MRSPVRIRVAAPDNPRGNPSGALVFYRACALQKASAEGLYGAATLALGRALRAKRAEFGPHICDKVADILTQCVNTWVAPDILASARSLLGSNGAKR